MSIGGQVQQSPTKGWGSHRGTKYAGIREGKKNVSQEVITVRSLSVLLLTVATAGLLALQAQSRLATATFEDVDTARSVLKDPSGAAVGDAFFRETPNGVLVKVDLVNIPGGIHGFHIHEHGRCEEPSFESAGGHFGPDQSVHGFFNDDGPHAGDLPNIHVPASQRLSFELILDQVTLGSGIRSLLEAEGSALVVHADADDYHTDPAGHAGKRIACGVITR